MTERLRYTGSQATNFLTGGVGQVEPGGEFEVDGDLVLGFLRRPDIERADGGGAGGGTPPGDGTPGTGGSNPPVTPPATAPLPPAGQGAGQPGTAGSTE